jgi:hypothetical protein
VLLKSWWGVLPLMLVACKAPDSAEADWSLSLQPHTHPNQDPFGPDTALKLVLRDPNGDQVYDLGTPTDGGTLSATGLPPASALTGVTDIGIAVETAGGDATAVNLDLLTAYGEANISKRGNTFSYDASGSKTLYFYVPRDVESATLTVYNSSNAAVFVGDLGALAAGNGSTTWDGTDNEGSEQSAGDYSFTVSGLDAQANTIDIEELTPISPGDTLDLPVLVSELESIGDLGSLPESKWRFYRSIAVVPPGSVYLFAGMTDIGNSTTGADVTGDIFKLASIDAGSPWDFDKIGELPDRQENLGPRIANVATTIEVDGKPMVLLTGGRPDLWIVNEAYDDWFLFDPATDEVVEKGPTLDAYSEHVAVSMSNGKVLLTGGWQSNDFDGGAELFDPSRGESEAVELGVETKILHMAASLGDEGALVCGGLSGPINACSSEDGQGSGCTGSPDATIEDTCVIVNLQGAVRTAASLPIPLVRASMTEAGEGRVLVTGGFTAPGGDIFSADEFFPTDQAWLYSVENDVWVEVGSLQTARSSHQGIPLSDGRVMIVGGVESDGIFLFPDVEVGCPEIYDPVNATFTELSSQCGSWGAGASPAVSSWPTVGAAFVKGFTIDEEPQDVVGFVGVGPF